MNFGLEPDQARFLEELRGYLDRWTDEGFVPAELLHELDHDDEHQELRREIVGRMGRDGWLSAKWPTEYGGQGRSHLEQWLMTEELGYRRLPYAMVAVLIQGPCLMAVGTEEQKQRYLPPIMRGEIEFALGYSEPNAGTDLASLQTRAVRDGDHYVVNGQKIWTSYAHYTSHIWLAARTGPSDSRHRGLTVFVLPTDTPGVTIRPIHTQADFITNEAFFDDVRIPVADRVGEENQGWRVIMLALDIERTTFYSMQTRAYEELVEWARTHERGGRPVIEDPHVRKTLAELSVDLEVARLLALRSAWMMGSGTVANAESSVNKVWNSDLRLRLGDAGLDVMGEEGQLRLGDEQAPNLGRTELFYRHAPLWRFAAGTNEIQRNIIAQRGLGMPRA
jgi:alkylation response protein AidB-like acyl-CoA dehydrogenase